MTKHDLKELAAMGAELGAAKAEVERLLVLLRDVNDVFEGQHPAPGLVIARVRNTLSQHAEPTDTYTAVDMATAAAQGFRDGQAAVEQAAAQTAPQKYDDVLLPFLSMMRAELHANAGKGDRPGWLAMDVKTALLEIFYHIGKLQKAAKKGDRDGIREYSADVANMSMMLADICGVLPEYQAQTAPQPEQSGLYTCIGKGGAYELIGRATTAGVLKVTGRFADEVIVYRDTESSALYCRAPGDFRLRMARAAMAAKEA